MIRLLWLFVVLLLLSCNASRNYSPTKKYPPSALLEDYDLLRSSLESKHPSLYWYTSRDSMNLYFELYRNIIRDSMTDMQFRWGVLSPLIDKIHCGHTTVNGSKAYYKWAEGKKFPSFPYFLKIWGDTMVVTGSVSRKDTLFKRGTIIRKVNGLDASQLVDIMFRYLPEDGYANNLNYIRVSSNFPYFHRSIFGLSKSYEVIYQDSNGREQMINVPLYKPIADSIKKDSLAKTVKPPKQKKLSRKEKQQVYRSLFVDSAGFAVMNLNSFTKGNIRCFLKKSFKEIRKKKIDHLVLDLRYNGGGRIGLSTLLTRYISRERFKVADTLYAKSNCLGKYTNYFKGGVFNSIQLIFTTRKQADGNYHLRHLENKIYKPRNNAYKGNVYVIISGPTFSAASIFCNAVKGQNGITLLGEETGGGWYGNNGVMIPGLKLPNTKAVISFPLFRIVQYQHVAVKGTGVLPDVYIGPDYEALVKGYDKKMSVVLQMIRDSLQTVKGK